MRYSIIFVIIAISVFTVTTNAYAIGDPSAQKQAGYQYPSPAGSNSASMSSIMQFTSVADAQPTIVYGGASCGQPMEITKTHVVTTTHVVHSTCTVTATKIVPVVTTVVEVKEVIKVVVKTKTQVVDRPVTKVQELVKTVSFCPTPTSTSMAHPMVTTPPPSQASMVGGELPAESDCIEFEDEVPPPPKMTVVPPPPIMTQPSGSMAGGEMPAETDCLEFEDEMPTPPKMTATSVAVPAKMTPPPSGSMTGGEMPAETDCLEFEDQVPNPPKMTASPPPLPKVTPPPPQTSMANHDNMPAQTDCIESQGTVSATPTQAAPSMGHSSSPVPSILAPPGTTDTYSSY